VAADGTIAKGVSSATETQRETPLRFIPILVAAAVASALSTAANAGELFAGLHLHDVKTPLDDSGLESGVDVSLGFRGVPRGPLLERVTSDVDLGTLPITTSWPSAPAPTWR